jgi:hypothetical protein
MIRVGYCKNTNIISIRGNKDEMLDSLRHNNYSMCKDIKAHLVHDIANFELCYERDDDEEECPSDEDIPIEFDFLPDSEEELNAVLLRRLVTNPYRYRSSGDNIS